MQSYCLIGNNEKFSNFGGRTSPKTKIGKFSYVYFYPVHTVYSHSLTYRQIILNCHRLYREEENSPLRGATPKSGSCANTRLEIILHEVLKSLRFFRARAGFGGGIPQRKF